MQRKAVIPYRRFGTDVPKGREWNATIRYIISQKSADLNVELCLKKESLKMWTGFIWLRIAFIGGIYDDINGHLNSLIDLNIPWPPEWVSYGGWTVLTGVNPNSTTWRFNNALFLIIPGLAVVVLINTLVRFTYELHKSITSETCSREQRNEEVIMENCKDKKIVICVCNTLQNSTNLLNAWNTLSEFHIFHLTFNA